MLALAVEFEVSGREVWHLALGVGAFVGLGAGELAWVWGSWLALVVPLMF